MAGCQDFTTSGGQFTDELHSPFRLLQWDYIVRVKAVAPPNSM